MRDVLGSPTRRAGICAAAASLTVFAQFALVQVQDTDGHPVGGQPDRDPGPDPAGGPGHDGDPLCLQ